jgi:nucleoside-diphosphate-sugar epimerase
MLAERGDDVVALDVAKDVEKLKNLRLPGVKFKLASCDITDFNAVQEVFKQHGVTRVVHTAAITFIPTAIKEPMLTFRVNTVGTFNLLEASRLAGVKKFVFISTTSAYGDFQYTPVDEKHPLDPKDVYGATKAAADRLAMSYFRTYQLPVVVVRTSSVYGPGDLENRAAKAFIENALTGQPMRLEGGGTAKREFSFVKDVARGVVLALDSEKAVGEAFNITGSGAQTVRELAMLIKEFIPGATVEEVGARKVDTKRGEVAISKAKDVLGYEPKYDLRTGVREYVKWFTDVYVPVMGIKVVNKPVIA